MHKNQFGGEKMALKWKWIILKEKQTGACMYIEYF